MELREKETPDDWRTFSVRSNLGECLLNQHRYSEAEPLLLSGYKGMEERAATIPPDAKLRLKEALQRLVRLNEATERSDSAAEWKQKLEKFEHPDA